MTALKRVGKTALKRWLPTMELWRLQVRLISGGLPAQASLPQSRAFAAFELLLLPEDRSMTPASFFVSGNPARCVMQRAALRQNKLKTQLFVSKITALRPYSDHKSLEAKTCSANK